jgi:hypothetical protein
MKDRNKKKEGMKEDKSHIQRERKYRRLERGNNDTTGRMWTERS